MSVTLADAFGWARNALGGDGNTMDEASAQAAVEQAKAQMAAITAAGEEAAKADVASRTDDAKKQAFFDAVHVIAAADGLVTSAEHAKIAAGLGAILGGLDEAAICSGLAGAKAFFDEHGVDGTAKAIAEAVPELDGRSSLLVISSAVAWLDHGVGTKEGLALQALARAFEIPIHDLHKLMAVGKVV